MKRAFAEERKELERAFKLEAGVLQGQKAELATRHQESQEAVRGLRERLQRAVELERDHARQLAQERDQLEEALQRVRSGTISFWDFASRVSCSEPEFEIGFGQTAQHHNGCYLRGSCWCRHVSPERTGCFTKSLTL